MLQRVTGEVLTQRERIAARARVVLASAGLPIAATEYDPDADVNFGVVITVDDVADASGGVVIGWACRRDLVEAATAAMAAGRLDDPAISHSGGVKQAMNTAITEILISAGFTVIDNPDDMNPLTLKVEAPERAEASPSLGPPIRRPRGRPRPCW